jgi:hypothetical protein
MACNNNDLPTNIWLPVCVAPDQIYFTADVWVKNKRIVDAHLMEFTWSETDLVWADRSYSLLTPQPSHFMVISGPPDSDTDEFGPKLKGKR